MTAAHIRAVWMAKMADLRMDNLDRIYGVTGKLCVELSSRLPHNLGDSGGNVVHIRLGEGRMDL